MVEKVNNSDLATASKAISPDEFHKYLGCVELQSIVLKSLKADLRRGMGSGDGRYDFSEVPKLVKNCDESAEVEVAYFIKAKSGKKIVTEIKVKYLVGFKLNKPLPQEFFVLYNHYSLPLQTFPYLRQCVHSLFSQMGLPPLIMPLRKYLLAGGK